MRSNRAPKQAEHGPGVRFVEVSKDREEPNEVEVPGCGRLLDRFEPRAGSNVEHGVVDVPVDETETMIERLDLFFQEVDDRPTDFDARVRANRNVAIDDCLSEADSTANIENVGRGQRREASA